MQLSTLPPLSFLKGFISLDSSPSQVNAIDHRILSGLGAGESIESKPPSHQCVPESPKKELLSRRIVKLVTSVKSFSATCLTERCTGCEILLPGGFEHLGFFKATDDLFFATEVFFQYHDLHVEGTFPNLFSRLPFLSFLPSFFCFFLLFSSQQRSFEQGE